MNKLTRKDRGLRKVIYYFIDQRGFWNEDVKLNLEQTDNGVGLTEDEKYRYKLLPEEFVHFALNTESLYGVSPLNYDRLMQQLLLDILVDNIDTVNNNGWKGIVIKGVKGINPFDFGLSQEQVSGNENWQDLVVQKFLSAIRKSIQGQKNKDNVVYLNGNLVEDMEKLDRGFRSLEYLGILENKSSVIAASMLGLLPAFLGDRDTSYSSNMGEGIRFAVNYAITISQEKYGKAVTSEILDTYINGKGILNYDYDFILNPLDLSDPLVESQTLERLGNFANTLRKGAFASINEVIEFLNEKIPKINLQKLLDEENEAGDIKTTEKPLLPVNFETMEDIEPIDEEHSSDDEEEEEEES